MSNTTVARLSAGSGHRTVTAMRVTLIVGGALAILGLALLGLGNESGVDALPSSEPAAAEVAEDDGEAADEIAVPVAVTYEIFLNRDPFEPVVEEDVPAAEPVADGTGTDDGSSTDPTAPGTPVTPGDSVAGSGSDGPLCTGTEEVVCDGQVVSLLDTIAADADTSDGDQALAIIQVGTIVYEASVGRTFAANFELLAIDGDCVNLRYGAEMFRLCVPSDGSK